MASQRVRNLIIAACIGAALLAAALIAGGISLFQTREGYFSPVFSPDRRAIYFIERRTRGIVWGLGFEHFTPPARAYVIEDRIRLKRVDRETGGTNTLIDWGPTPLVGRHLRNYRTRIFSALTARLQFRDDGRLHFGLGLSIPLQPRSKSWSIRGASAPGTLGATAPEPWQPGRRPLTGHARHVLDGDWELVHIGGEAAFPPAIVLYHAKSGEAHIVRRSADFSDQFPSGIPARVLEAHSVRQAVDRLDTLAATRARLLAEFKAQGLSDGDARIRTIGALQALGYYRTPPMLKARKIGAPGPDSAVFHISEQEFRAGLFQDIAKALASPGTAVEHRTGTYLRYSGLDTSEKLKKFLDDGGTRFYLTTSQGAYEIRINPSRPATR